VLCEFRARLLEGQTEQQIVQPLLDIARKHGWLKERGKQRTDSTHVFGAIRTLSRLETVGETMRATLNVLATVAPEWLCSVLSPDWFDRYDKRFEAYRLPKGKAERQRYAEQVGADGFHLLQALYRKTAPSWLREVPMVQTLRQRKDCSLKSMWWIQASLYAEVLVNSQHDHAMTLIGPVAGDTRGPRQSRTRIGCDALYD